MAQNIVFGTDGRDLIFTGRSNDHIVAGAGADFIRSGGGNDLIEAGDGRDFILAGSGNDIVDTGAGSDFADGGRGTDTARYAGDFAEYKITVFGRLIFVTDLTTGDVDTLTNFELLQFAEGVYDPRAANNGPLADDIAATFVQGDAPLTLELLVEANAFDFDGDTIEIVSVETNARLGFDPTTGQVTYDPGDAFGNLGANETRTDSFTFDLTDGTETISRTIQFTVQGVNDLPTGAVLVTGEVKEGETLTADVSSLDDPDGLGVLSYQWQSLGDDGTTWTDIDGAAGDTFAPGEAEVGRPVRVVVSYTDDGGTDEQVESQATDLVVPANSAPIANDDQFIVSDDFMFQELDVLANDSDPDSDPLTIVDAEIITPLSGLSVLEFGGILRLVAALPTTLGVLQEGERETIKLRYTVSDGSGFEADASVEVVINGTDQAPVQLPFFNASLVSEDSGVLPIELLAGFVDPEGGPVSLVDLTLPSGIEVSDIGELDGSTLRVDTGAAFFQTLGPSQSIDLDFDVVVADSTGLQASGRSATKLIVAGVNDLPQGDVLIAGTPKEGQELTADTSGLADAEGLGALSFQWQALADDGTTWTDIPGATASSLTPGATLVDRALRVVVSYTDNGGTPETVESAATAPIMLDPRPPDAVDDTFVESDGFAVLLLDVLDNDSDPNNDPLTIIAAEIVSARDGIFLDFSDTALQLEAALDLPYSPLEEGQSEVIELRYTVSDGNGGEDEATVEIAVQGTNQAPLQQPLAQLDFFFEDDGIQSVDLTRGFFDPEGGEVSLVQLVALLRSITLSDTVEVVGNEVLIDTSGDSFQSLGPNDSVELGFIVEVADPTGLTTQARSLVDVLIVGRNDDPEGTVTIVGVPAFGVQLSVDSSGLSDPEGVGALSYQWEASSDGTNWSAIAGANGDIYTPGAGQLGQQLRVTLSYTDGGGTAETVTGEATEAVAQNAPPITQDDFITIPATTTNAVIIPVLSNDSDPEGQQLTLVSADIIDLDFTGSIPSQLIASIGPGEVSISPENGGSIVYDPNGAFDALFSFPLFVPDLLIDVRIDYVVTDGLTNSSGDLVVTVDTSLVAGGEASGSIAASVLAIEDETLPTATLGNDDLVGNPGSDALDGLAGADTLNARAGDDLLTGGADADLFIFENDPNGGNSDTITDFTPGEDVILRSGFSGLNFTALDSNDDGIVNAGDGPPTNAGDLGLDLAPGNQLTLQGIGQLQQGDLLFV